MYAEKLLVMGFIGLAMFFHCAVHEQIMTPFSRRSFLRFFNFWRAQVISVEQLIPLVLDLQFTYPEFEIHGYDCLRALLPACHGPHSHL